MTYKLRFALIAAIFTFCAVSFAENGDSSQNETKAVVYVYRLSQWEGTGGKAPIFCDGKKIVEIGKGRFARVEIDPGIHEFRSTDPQSGAREEFDAGKSYYLKAELYVGPVRSKWRLNLIPAAQGDYEASRLKPSN